MADFVFSRVADQSLPARFQTFYDTTFRPRPDLTIGGNEGTFAHVENEHGFIVVVGHVYAAGQSLTQTLSEILKTFDESQVADLKRTLYGQYTLIIEKANALYLFSDCLQVRNVFYSPENAIVSSSFTAIEDALDTTGADLDPYKVFEYQAMHHCFYPAFLGSTTLHRRILRLRPFEYLKVDLQSGAIGVHPVSWEIDNTKEPDVSVLGSRLAAALREIVHQPDFRNQKVGATLTGGYDSRLIASVAKEYYPTIAFRIASARDNRERLIDLEMARNAARAVGGNLDVYWMEDEADQELFYEMTEGFASTNNAAMTPLFRQTDVYALGTGGCFGTELFYPLAHRTVEGFIAGGMGRARGVFQVDDATWERFHRSLVEEFDAVKRHYAFAVADEADLVRMLWMLNVGWFASYLSAQHGIKGRQIEPYGSMPVIEVAFKVPASRLGSKKHLGRTNLTQKFALREVNPTMARVMTRHHCPMTPLDAGSFVPHVAGYLSHVVGALGRKISKPPAVPPKTARFPGGTYVSNGWNAGFMRRIRERYGSAELA